MTTIRPALPWEPGSDTEYSDIRHILPRPSQIVASRRAADLAEAILAAHAEREAIAAEQRNWVLAHATIERAARELERVYAGYLRTDVPSFAG